MILSPVSRFQRYGDIPDKEGAGGTVDATGNTAREWPLWEVFIRSKAGLDHKHVGSLHAADAGMAIENARDVYTRRLEGVSIWAVESGHVHASSPDDQGAFFEPVNDKVYCHPTFSTDAGGTAETTGNTAREWPLWEVFIRSKPGLDYKHVGSLHAADAEMAMENARKVFTRGPEGVSIWVVESRYVHASDPDDQEAFFDPANDKVYRHPTFYTIPVEITHM